MCSEEVFENYLKNTVQMVLDVRKYDWIVGSYRLGVRGLDCIELKRKRIQFPHNCLSMEWALVATPLL